MGGLLNKVWSKKIFSLKSMTKLEDSHREFEKRAMQNQKGAMQEQKGAIQEK